MIHTQGIKYAGSKLKLLPHIKSIVDNLDVNTILDGFSGSTRVSQMFANSGYTVTSNDLSIYSKVFGNCYLKNDKPANYYQPILNHLNSLNGFDGWFSDHYGGLDYNGSAIQLDNTRKPWQLHNTRKLDAIRLEIDNMKLPEIEKDVVLTSLILALDNVDNTLGHFTSYLKNWSPRSYKQMELLLPNINQNQLNHTVINGDVFDVNGYHDLVYYDPPYGSNNVKMPSSRVRYQSYYHIWSTICLNDKPDLFGVANRRLDSSDKVIENPFEDFRSVNGVPIAYTAIDKLIGNSNSKYVLLSYNNNGIIMLQDILDIIENHGSLVSINTIDHKKHVMANMKWTNEWVNTNPNSEYLILMRMN